MLIAYAVAGVGVLLLAGLVLVVRGHVRRFGRARDEVAAGLGRRVAAVPALRTRSVRPAETLRGSRPLD